MIQLTGLQSPERILILRMEKLVGRMMQKPYTLFSGLILSLLISASMGVCIFNVQNQASPISQAYGHLCPIPGPMLSTKDITLRTLGTEQSQAACIGCPDDNPLDFVYDPLGKHRVH